MAGKSKWVKRRHRVIRAVAAPFLFPYTKWKYGIKVERFKEQGNRQYLILMNHQTPFDQFFVEMAFKGAIYYLATEDIFSKGWVSSLIRYLVAPIPIKKQTTDIRAVMNCLRVAKEGGTIAIAPEGNRTYSGRTEYMKPTIAPLVKKLGLPLALFCIEGGYGVQPRWSDVVRKGKMRAYVSKVIEPETYQHMTDPELFQLIRDGLEINESSVDGCYYHKKSAEYLERAMYVCPFCGLSVFESQHDIITCKKCGRKIRYQPTKELEGIGFTFPFRFVGDWYAYQCDFVVNLKIEDYTEQPMYEDIACLSEVIVYEKKNIICENAQITLYADKIIIACGMDNVLNFSFEDLSAMSVLGRNKLNIYHDKKIYQVRGDKRFNALKYVNIFYRYKNIDKEYVDGKFLGL